MGKLQRNYELTVETFAGPLVIRPPFSLEFDIVRSTLKSAGHASFRIHGLGRDDRNRIRKDINITGVYRGVQLRAGYGDSIPLIFKGNIANAWSNREKPGMVTSIQTYDGAFGIINSESSHAVASDSDGTGPLLKDTLIDLMGDLEQVRVGKCGDFLDDQGNAARFSRGISMSGNTSELLDTYSNGNFFIDLETAHCLADHECLQGPFDVINSESGLLGTPILEQNRLTFDILFEPRLLLAQKISLESFTAEKFNGDYKVFSLKHRGIISEKVCGAAITTVTLWQPEQPLVVVN